MGYMASGKSRIGKELAQKLGRKFVDLDDFIVEKEQLTIPEIFELKGEPYFRKKELEYLKEILIDERDNFVLSIGGGTPTFNGAIELINELSYSIYLQANVQTLYDRLVPEKLERPLLTKIPDDVLMDYISIHLFERNAYYMKADLRLSVDGKSVEKIVNEICENLNYSK